MFLLALVLLDLKILWFVFFHPEIAGNLCVLVVVLKIFPVVFLILIWILLKDFVRSMLCSMILYSFGIWSCFSFVSCMILDQMMCI